MALPLIAFALGAAAGVVASLSLGDDFLRVTAIAASLAGCVCLAAAARGAGR